MTTWVGVTLTQSVRAPLSFEDPGRVSGAEADLRVPGFEEVLKNEPGLCAPATASKDAPAVGGAKRPVRGDIDPGCVGVRGGRRPPLLASEN